MLLNDKVSALDAGADDYLDQAFFARGIAGSGSSLFTSAQATLKTEITCGDIVLILLPVKCIWTGKEMPLTLKEFNILEYFIRNPNKVLTRDEVLDHVWDYNFSSLE
jgi:two-component system copper resistance phosphate regulon response regulator CusR